MDNAYNEVWINTSNDFDCSIWLSFDVHSYVIKHFHDFVRLAVWDEIAIMIDSSIWGLLMEVDDGRNI